MNITDKNVEQNDLLFLLPNQQSLDSNTQLNSYYTWPSPTQLLFFLNKCWEKRVYVADDLSLIINSHKIRIKIT